MRIAISNNSRFISVNFSCVITDHVFNSIGITNKPAFKFTLIVHFYHSGVIDNAVEINQIIFFLKLDSNNQA